MRLLKWILILLVLAALGAATAAGGVLYAFYYYGKSLPDHKALAEYEPPVTTRVHAGDGRLLAEFATEKRIFVPIGAIPKPVIYAFLSAEDKAFYEHPGVDLMSIAGAMVTNLKNIGQGRRLIGASTITQQVAKNFLLTNEVSWVRKIKEAILALRIEKAFDKDRILELYLNEIYLGYSSYGAAAAALNYFNKSMDELTIGEAAFLAALPKAPNNYHPIRKREAAIDRRNWVISRLLEDARITPDQAAAAKLEPLNVRERAGTEFVQADYFAEEVRKELAQRFGEEALYQGGLSVRATVDPKLQAIADKALRDGLIDYDRRHGYRGPVTTIELGAGWQERLASVEPPKGTGDWLLGVIGAVADKQADIHFADGGRGIIDLDDVKWAREPLDDQKVGDS
ncbi:MAG: transglycosylase domain-containing protein, partial [Rhodospirillales bacterium]